MPPPVAAVKSPPPPPRRRLSPPGIRIEPPLGARLAATSGSAPPCTPSPAPSRQRTPRRPASPARAACGGPLLPCGGGLGARPMALAPLPPPSPPLPAKGISDVDDLRQKAVCTERYRRRDEDESKRPVSDIDVEREEECGICMEMNSKVVLPTCSHAMCMKCYHQWRSRSQSCPFCRDSLKQQVNSGDLWMFTDCRDLVDMATVTRENIRRLFMYIEKLPLITPGNILYAYDSHIK